MCLSAEVEGFVIFRYRRASHSRITRQSSAKRLPETELLVDGDVHSVEDVQFAIRKLQQMRQKVRTHVFAEPGRERNKKWRQLFSMPAVVFHPVLRKAAEEGEANDEAISHQCSTLSTASGRVSISLLVSDMGYLDVIQQTRKRGTAVLVFIPAMFFSVLRNYRSAGVHVVEIEPRATKFCNVKAVLHSDGSGRVELTDPCYPDDIAEELELCHGFLRDLGYAQEEREQLVHSAAKFWHINSLGQFTVFPLQLGIQDLSRVVSRCRGRAWRRQRGEWALVIPVAAMGGRPTKKAIKTYGSGVARKVFRGGGPFLLPDSKSMVQQALTKLGYVDDCMNADLAEAMLVFANAAENQHVLRKINFLPAAGDAIADVRDKLRCAFVSHLSDGKWRRAPKDGLVRSLLCKDGFLADPTAATAKQVFCAMGKYAKKHSLPRMKTYNGYAFRILRDWNTTPNATGTIEFSA